MTAPNAPNPHCTRADRQNIYDALTWIRALGGHPVLLRGKRPAWTAWNKRRPGVDTCLAHLAAGGQLGLIPFSLGFAVLDVDGGDPAALARMHPPALRYRSWSGRDGHFWYRSLTGLPNLKFSACGCTGEVRGANGYVLLPRLGETLPRIEAAVRTPAGGQLGLFPDEVLPANRPAADRPPASLWERLSEWAFRQRLAGRFNRMGEADVLADVLAKARELAAAHAAGADSEQVRRAARCVTRRTLEPVAAWKAKQAARGRRSGKARRDMGRDWRTVELRDKGQSWPEIGRTLGISHTTAMRAYKRYFASQAPADS